MSTQKSSLDKASHASVAFDMFMNEQMCIRDR